MKIRSGFVSNSSSSSFIFSINKLFLCPTCKNHVINSEDIIALLNSPEYCEYCDDEPVIELDFYSPDEYSGFLGSNNQNKEDDTKYYHVTVSNHNSKRLKILNSDGITVHAREYY